jgi:hypothetical protein
MSTDDTVDFSWKDADQNHEIVIPKSPETAVFANAAGGIVIRQAAWPDDDSWVYFDRCYAVQIAKAILREAGRTDLEIVKVSEITVVGREGNVMTVPAEDLDKIDAISRDMRAEERRRRTKVAEVVDSDQTADTKDRTAAERQRRRRQKQRQRDSVTEAVTGRDNHRDADRDIDADTVTTAPALPELDLHGGESTARTH